MRIFIILIVFIVSVIFTQAFADDISCFNGLVKSDFELADVEWGCCIIISSLNPY